MKKRWRRVAHIVLALSVLLLAVCLLLLWLVQTVPEGYQTELQVSNTVHDPHVESWQQTIDNIKDDIWHRDELVFEVTQQQLNAWLATRLESNPRISLPEGIKDPRVFLTRNQQTLIFTIDRSRFSAAVSIVFHVRLAEQPNTIEISLVSVHAGRLPIRIKRAFDEIEAAMVRTGVGFQWKSGTNRQVALIVLPDQVRVRKKVKNLTLTELRFKDALIEVRADLD